jgi:hypothetical protein
MKIPPAETKTISLRAFAEKIGSEPGKRRPRLRASEWTLVFDTETRTDMGHALRFGVYQLRQAGTLKEAGIFHAPDIDFKDKEMLEAYARANQLEFMTRDEFVEDVFFEKGYAFRATIVGFNLPFDLSRLAISHAAARGNQFGGFSLKLSEHKWRPRVQIKHLSRKSAMMRFAAPFQWRHSRSGLKRGRKQPVERGSFVDLNTLATALFSRSFKLSTLSKFLKVPTQKEDTDEHGKALTHSYIQYAVDDVQASWECYGQLLARFQALELRDLGPHDVYSDASLGKGYLNSFNIKPWRDVQTCPASMVALILSTYFGGRSEVRIRLQRRQVVLCDFLSMYPTVCTLMGLWWFVVADGMTWRDATEDAKKLLRETTLAEIQRQDTWRKLTVLVRVKPDRDVFPVRADYDGSGQPTIGANYLSADGSLWFTLADCLAAKLLSGKEPEVLEALVFEPGPLQSGLQPITLSGHAARTIDPSNEDFYKRLIEWRQEVKRARDAASGAEWETLDAEQNALKIAANATSYGIFVEIIVEEVSNKVRLRVHHATGEPFELSGKKCEKPGRYFHPLLATLITGAARLMLATAERLVADNGLEWAFCDTDSMAIAKPEVTGRAEFLERVDNIVRWFVDLNPYAFEGSILKVEDVNFRLDDTKAPEPLYCWCVSAKRYALFNIDEHGKPVLRKASQHGLGHLRAPYDDKNPAKGLPAPATKLSNIGVELWQHDLWWIIVEADLGGSTDVNLDYHEALARPAVSRYGATSPRLLSWLDGYNSTRSYAEQVKPFGFLLAFLAKDDFITEVVLDGTEASRTWTKPKPIAPYHKDTRKALLQVRDRKDQRRQSHLRN